MYYFGILLGNDLGLTTRPPSLKLQFRHCSTYLGVSEALKDFLLLVERANDIIECRIQNVLKEIESTVLCELPHHEHLTVEEFVKNTKVFIQSVGNGLLNSVSTTQLTTKLQVLPKRFYS